MSVRVSCDIKQLHGTASTGSLLRVEVKLHTFLISTVSGGVRLVVSSELGGPQSRSGHSDDKKTCPRQASNHDRPTPAQTKCLRRRGGRGGRSVRTIWFSSNTILFCYNIRKYGPNRKWITGFSPLDPVYRFCPHRCATALHRCQHSNPLADMMTYNSSSRDSQPC
jgi:hypothetical protein